LLVGNFRFALQLFRTCQKIIDSIGHNHPQKLLYEKTIIEMEAFIFNQVKGVIVHLYNDLLKFYNRLKENFQS